MNSILYLQNFSYIGLTDAASYRFGFFECMLLGLLKDVKNAFRLFVRISLKRVTNISGNVYKKIFRIFSSGLTLVLLCICFVYFSLYEVPLYSGFSTNSFNFLKVSNRSNLSKKLLIVLEMYENAKMAKETPKNKANIIETNIAAFNVRLL